MRNNSVYILSVDAKDLYLAEQLDAALGYKSTNGKGEANLRKYINTLDYSLDLIKLREVYSRVFRNKRFSFWVKKKEYSKQVINVTFKYSVKEYNLYNANTYVKIGHSYRPELIEDNVIVEDGVLVCIRVGEAVNSPVSEDILGRYFRYEDGKYVVADYIPSLVTTDELRKRIYRDGFNCDNTHFIRWKRSCGSSRVGKCLFINEALYKPMHKYDLCGLTVKEGQDIDLAGFESYTALTLSSIIDTIEIDPRNILVIDDYDSSFEDEIIAVDEEDGKLKCAREKRTITNTIWDGQSLIDKSIMGAYADKGMILLRNSYFKSCCFNCNLQQWFADNNVTNVSQLNGFTLATSISDIKFVTTPTSIKYLKFGTLQDWLNRIDPHFGLVKYDKPTHFFEGKLVQIHYQLLNSIQMSRAEVKELLEPSFNFILQLKNDPDILRYYLKCSIPREIVPSMVSNKNQVVFKLLGVNNRFAETKLYREFLYDLMKSIYKRLKSGHVLVNGNYSTLCGNPIEMLQATIGQFNGMSQMGVGNVCSTRFPFGQTLLGSRSPHITMSNVWLPTNRKNFMIERYMNSTNEIVYINSIGENVLNKLSGCDFDSDCVMLTDNPILIKAAKRNDGKFPIACGYVKAQKHNRKYCAEDIFDLDVRTSSNRIGEIVNLSQELNTKLWNILNHGGRMDEVEAIYGDICKLNVLSNIEIDKAKREYCVDSVAELKRIRERHNCVEKDGENIRAIKPFFFAHISRQKGYYNAKKKIYKKHRTTMDYLQTEINRFKREHSQIKDTPNKPLSIIINKENYDYIRANHYWSKAQKIISLVADAWTQVKEIASTEGLPTGIWMDRVAEIREDCIAKLSKYKINNDEAIYILNKLDSDSIHFRQYMLYVLFDPKVPFFYNVLNENHEGISEVVEDNTGEIDIYGYKYKKVQI